ncbi:hypothetical protein BKA66DRAFT_565978 [Pyrenochaeta sp. MPI-SDFR-AT-0127]|nr:hypothetical protein BKA66DRAFT_565978 [Pyrenochaeta sp. MPI-SDFR-AT-0127]
MPNTTMWPAPLQSFKDRIISPLSPKYTEVPDGDSEKDSENGSGFIDKQELMATKPNRRSRFLLALLLLAIGTGIGFLVASIVRRPGAGPQAPASELGSHHHNAPVAVACQPSYESTPQPKMIHDCGSDIASAKAANCAFDMLSHTWVPKPCHDSETDNEFREWIFNPNRTGGAFPYFLSSTLSANTHIDGIDALSAVPGDTWIWSHGEEHVGHCIFVVRRIHRALEGKFRWSDDVANFDHTSHCAHEMLESILEKAPLRRFEGGTVTLKVKFDKCTH